MRIALCEADTLTPDRDAGARADADLLAALTDLGHEVLLALEAAGDLPERVRAFGPHAVIISRPGLFARLEPLLRPLAVPLIYLGHDLHFVRLGLQEGVVGGLAPGAARIMRLVEARCYAAANLAVLPTREDAERGAREFPGSRCMAMDYWAMPSPASPPSAPSERIVFVGAAAHAPNADAVRWFIETVWPRHRRRAPQAELLVCGAWPAPGALADVEGVRFVGTPDDEALDAIIGGARVGIAPLRFGAGMKRKTVHYLSLGAPVIGTRYAVEGLADADGATPGVIRAETAEEWATALDALRDDDTWREHSRAGWGFVRHRFSPERYRAGVAGMLAAALDR